MCLHHKGPSALFEKVTLTRVSHKESMANPLAAWPALRWVSTAAGWLAVRQIRWSAATCHKGIARYEYGAALRVAPSGSLGAPNLVRWLLLHGSIQSSYVWLIEHRALTPCFEAFQACVIADAHLLSPG